jgi:hypothetical protein
MFEWETLIWQIAHDQPGPAASSSPASPTSSIPLSPPQFSWDFIQTLTTCNSVLFTWSVAGNSDGTLDVHITNAGVDQTDSPISPHAVLQRAGNEDGDITEEIGSTIPLSQFGLGWDDVNVPQGWYVVQARSSAFKTVTSAPFFVQPGASTVCVNFTVHHDTTSSSSTSSFTHASSSSLPRSSVSATTTSALSSQGTDRAAFSPPTAQAPSNPVHNASKNMIVGATVGGAVSGIILIGFAVMLFFCCCRRKHRAASTMFEPPITPMVQSASAEGLGSDHEQLHPPHSLMTARSSLLSSAYSDDISMGREIQAHSSDFSPDPFPPYHDISGPSTPATCRSPATPYAHHMNFSRPNLVGPLTEDNLMAVDEPLPTPAGPVTENALQPAHQQPQLEVNEHKPEDMNVQVAEEEDIIPAYPSGVSIELSALSSALGTPTLSRKSLDSRRTSTHTGAGIYNPPHSFSADPADNILGHDHFYNVHDPSLSRGNDGQVVDENPASDLAYLS